MRSLNCLAILCLIPFFIIGQSDVKVQKPIEVKLIFKSGKSKITLKHKKQLEVIEYELSNGNEVWIYPLTSYSKKSSVSNATNYKMSGKQVSYCFDPNSRKQANAVLGYLQDKKLGSIKIETDFSYPYSGPSVRLKISKGNFIQSTPEITKKEKPKVEENIALKDYFPEKKSQYFIINPKKDTLIEGEEGTKLFFASGSLLCDEPVQIELKEFYKSSDFLKADLQTVSNGKLLSTGGTIFLDARQQSNLKEQVQINPSRGINAEFTEGRNDPEMEVFLKDKNSTETNWLRDRKRSWRYTLNYMLNENETYRKYVFNSPNDYQEYVTSGRAKEVEEEWVEVLKSIALEKWNAERKAEMEKRRIEREKERKIDEVLVSRLTINKLGFINADKFYKEETQPLVFDGDKSRKATYYAIITGKSKGILKGYGSDKIRFRNLPVNQPVTIVAISITKKDKFIYKKKLNSIKENIGEVALFKASEDELDSLLSSVNQ